MNTRTGSIRVMAAAIFVKYEYFPFVPIDLPMHLFRSRTTVVADQCSAPPVPVLPIIELHLVVFNLN